MADIEFDYSNEKELLFHRLVNNTPENTPMDHFFECIEYAIDYMIQNGVEKKQFVLSKKYGDIKYTISIRVWDTKQSCLDSF